MVAVILSVFASVVALLAWMVGLRALSMARGNTRELEHLVEKMYKEGIGTGAGDADGV